MKVLLLTAATGAGHIKAANAVEEYIRENTGWDVRTVDCLKAVGRLLDKTVCDSYLFMAKKAPMLFGRLYKRTNRQNVISSLVPKLSGLFSNMLYPSIEGYGPDVIITTHPFATEMVADLKQDGLVKAPLICVITDYGAHRAYIAQEVDSYVVASDDMIPELQEFGVPLEKICPFGIPVHGVFFDPQDQKMLLRQLNLDPDLPTLLFMAGSFGVSGIIKLYRDLAATPVKMQIIVITGRNQKLFEAFEKEIAATPAIPTRLIYFTDEVEKYMHAADLLVTKPGGLTVSEALACNLPMAVFDAIPGPEDDNARFLKTHDMCVHLEKGSDFAQEISQLLQEKKRLRAMRENCAGFDKSQSIPNILILIQKLVSAAQKPGERA
ncbi:glycosyltransferase [Acutalibacter sp. 1XD8-33]|uniref:MGDG synthase family glycosyltransferase n=1 Tax=Acutalibacter sp. 1XD8-33 TaxID=2320081 RepID=UPI000EA2BB99|nr:glycosyltransferase [Acutalibacter sp. 1XD8-33]RKJ41163.1 glycosyltransferase [Acutalibacter sp. 1XD8-33]